MDHRSLQRMWMKDQQHLMKVTSEIASVETPVEKQMLYVAAVHHSTTLEHLTMVDLNY